jgi:protein TonB
MSPRSLLFSSDEGTSRTIRRAFADLDIEVAAHTEIFSALEALTSGKFELIVADEDDGPEASFLLQTARESKGNSLALFVAVRSHLPANASAESADVVLPKPVSVDDLKYALLSTEAFLQKMQGWVHGAGTNGGSDGEQSAGAADSRSLKLVKPVEGQARFELVSNRVARKLAADGRALHTVPDSAIAKVRAIRVSAPPATNRESARPDPPEARYETQADRGSGKAQRMLLFATLLLASGCLGYQLRNPRYLDPLRTMLSNAKQKMDREVARYLGDGDSFDDDFSDAASVPVLAKPSPNRNSTPRRIHVAAWKGAAVASDFAEDSVGDTDPETADQDTLSSEGEAEAYPATLSSQPSPSLARIQIPESLTSPPPGAKPSAPVAPFAASRLFSPLQPVNLSEDAAQRLLLEKVAPFYPEQAVKLGIRGPVILEAWIARDGTIRDLKLIQGPILLGRAAYDAVKQWRYKPYAPNGEAVEAQTYVTVNFNQP